jgi:hypothetical protein
VDILHQFLLGQMGTENPVPFPSGTRPNRGFDLDVLAAIHKISTKKGE